MGLMFQFDLQLLAEDGGGSGEAPAGGNPAPTDGGQGGTGGNNGGNPNNGDNPPAGRTTLLGGSDNPANGGDKGGGTQQTGGVPESYDFSGIVPDGMQYDETAAKAFGDIARSAGLSQEQASNIAKYGMQYMQQGVDAVLKQQDAEVAQWGEEAKQQLGADLQPMLAKASTAMNALETKFPGLRSALNVTGAGNRVEVIRAMAAVGELMGEDGGHDGDGAGGGNRNPYPNTDWSKYE